MAAPTYVQAGAGVTDAGGVWTADGPAGGVTIGNIIIYQIVQDGTGTGQVTIANTVSSIANLAGTANTMTVVAVDQPIGSPTVGLQHIYIGRAAATVFMNLNGNNSGTDDLYIRAYEFANGNAGATLSAVIENGTAGTAINGFGTSASVADTGVTTLGSDRLALNFVGINDDASGLTAFAGETGGDWTLATAIYETATGTDATVALMTAAMAAAGTINGGADAITSLGWGVVGFALIWDNCWWRHTRPSLHAPPAPRQPLPDHSIGESNAKRLHGQCREPDNRHGRRGRGSSGTRRRNGPARRADRDGHLRHLGSSGGPGGVDALKVIRGHTTTGNGTTTTPRPCSPGDAAAAFTAKIYGATIASAGTAVDMHSFGLNVRAGYEIFYPQECGFFTSGTSLLVVRMMAALADAVSVNMTFWVREMP